ncbi:hypothetical protein NHP20013_10660 [Helicobacter bizzozeronii]|nr:hypothetical protein NHP20013_10660 [Helicobacter bizzozeronii]
MGGLLERRTQHEGYLRGAGGISGSDTTAILKTTPLKRGETTNAIVTQKS